MEEGGGVVTVPYTREQLDVAKCGTPGCDCAGPLTVSGQCHKGMPVVVSYDWTTGVLSIDCAICGQGIVQIKVAER
jgi:hypothetical protein